GTYDLARSSMRGLDSEEVQRRVSGPDEAARLARLPEDEARHFADEAALARDGLKHFDLASFLEGHLTPVFFGSALKNYGVRDLIDGLGSYAPPPRSHR